MKKKLFICMTDVPFPVRKNGISVRYSVIIKHLSILFDIHLLIISNFGVQNEEIKEANLYVKKCSVFIRRSYPVSVLRKIFIRLKSLFPRQVPFPIYCYDERIIGNFISNEVRNVHYNFALTVCTSYAHLVQDNVSADKYVMDAIDSVFVYMHRQIYNNIIGRIDVLAVKNWEKNLVYKMGFSSFVSHQDLALLFDNNIDGKKVGVIPNGIYINDYTSDRVVTDGFVLGYLGHMGYPPNIEAAKRLVLIYLELKHIYKDLRLFIIGRMPTEEILRFQNCDGITVTGSVKSIWPYVNAVDVFVFPMERGAGQQNKLLEAMFASRPVVTTSVGNGGVGAIHGESALIANTNEELSSSIIDYYNSVELREKIGNAGRKFVMDTYSWPEILLRLEKNYFEHTVDDVSQVS